MLVYLSFSQADVTSACFFVIIILANLTEVLNLVKNKRREARSFPALSFLAWSVVIHVFFRFGITELLFWCILKNICFCGIVVA